MLLSACDLNTCIEMWTMATSIPRVSLHSSVCQLSEPQPRGCGKQAQQHHTTGETTATEVALFHRTPKKSLSAFQQRQRRGRPLQLHSISFLQNLVCFYSSYLTIHHGKPIQSLWIKYLHKNISQLTLLSLKSHRNHSSEEIKQLT